MARQRRRGAISAPLWQPGRIKINTIKGYAISADRLGVVLWFPWLQGVLQRWLGDRMASQWMRWQ
jgi:hypothetical protein